MHLLWRNLLKVSPDIPLQSIFKASSDQAQELNRVTNYFFWAAGFILLVVAILTAYMLYRFREKNANAQKTLSTRWEVLMIGVPSVMVAVFLYFSIVTMNHVQSAVKNAQPDVVITGHQWWWEASYTGTGVKTANEIHLPAGKRLLLKLLSDDVIHDWWIPALGNKMDMVPTQENYLWVTIKEPGIYYGACSEFCGPQHAHMRIKVIAEKEDQFNKWLTVLQEPALQGPELISGQKLFMSKTCANCHRINGTSAQGTTGPDLTHLAGRSTLLAGLINNNVENLERFIRDPQKIKPESRMPEFLLDDTTIKAIATYLYSLK